MIIGVPKEIKEKEFRVALTPAGAEPIVRLEALEKYFGSNHVLRGVSLAVRRHETVVLIGRSGSGKTTFLRCLNFLERVRPGKGYRPSLNC